ncbi:replication factor RFC1 C terminal domain-containing protein [Cokeromyces recurvatus]|uniref:replication factor RFC1 C terminal domain-containing protein n=1 Tax=Cokeromyces recurvatus TaxID=90255 RepID=UPI002220196D|nr:replication factor RFC1 C terminal domain-containing protein [Cokeromyces recurvatus]KAI7908090.1 replication factor RFC1 C terminal domain-containing protein [Cokeromyces recurvatus]
MGIEKYFSPSQIKKKESTNDLKRIAKEEANEDDEFQAPILKSRHFTSKNTEQINPKDFFESKSKTSTKPVSKTTKVKATEKVIVPKKEETSSRKHKIISKDDDDYKEDNEDNNSDNDYKEDSDEAKPISRPQKKIKPNSPKKETEEKPKPAGKKNYFAMLKNQEPPKALGTRPEPVGAPNCLGGLTFVISGQYETLTRDQTKDIVMRYGGRVTTAVSGKTNYLLLGRDAGESKIAKAKSLGTKILDEDAFYKFVESSAPKKEAPIPAIPAQDKGKDKVTIKESPANGTKKTETNSQQLWTEKYKPKELKEIIGNKELVRRISEWLGNWQKNYSEGFKGNGDEMNQFRAILISGPPGIGKTTTANVVAAVNGYEALEFNASDARSKKVLEENITEMIDNRTMTEFLKSNREKKTETKFTNGKKVVLIMDEVDGMTAGDRGGSAELAMLIRKTKIPVICICNDPRSTKVAPLLRVCFEAKFKRTPAAQIRSRILSIAFKEGLKIQPNAVDELVSLTQNDIRQIINILSTYRLKESDMTYDQAKAVGKNNQKYSILNLFDIPIELLSSSNWRSKSLNEKYDIYFHEYSLSHLMMFENYLKCVPEKAASRTGNATETDCNHMDLIAKAANAMADGDLVDTMIHGTVQHYSLMPVHSIFSCVRPANYMEGSLRTRMNFPGWLGQNSKAGKYARALSDVQTRMRLRASGDKYEIRQNYIPTLNERIFGDLEKENFEGAMEIMDTYYLDRENLDTLNELVFTESGKLPLVQIPTKVKTAFTREYNSKNHPILFQVGGVPIKKIVSGPKEDAEGTIIEEDEPIGDDSPVEEESVNEEDAMDSKYIKEASSKKRKTTGTGSSSNSRKLKSKK